MNDFFRNAWRVIRDSGSTLRMKKSTVIWLLKHETGKWCAGKMQPRPWYGYRTLPNRVIDMLYMKCVCDYSLRRRWNEQKQARNAERSKKQPWLQQIP